MKKSRTRLAGALAAAIVAGVGVTAASAATLGGFSGKSLGADSAVVASCDTDGVSISYTTAYDAASQKYVISGATVAGIATACSGQLLRVQLTGTGGVALAAATDVTLGSNATQAVVFASPPRADLVQGSSIVITG